MAIQEIQTPGTHPESEAALVAGLAELRNLVENGDVEAARALVQTLAVQWPVSPRVQHYVQVLALPQLIHSTAAPGRKLDQERAWLRAHAAEHPGCWLAVHGQRLIAADHRLGPVLERVRATPGAEDAVLHYQPRPEHS